MTSITQIPAELVAKYPKLAEEKELNFAYSPVVFELFVIWMNGGVFPREKLTSDIILQIYKLSEITDRKFYIQLLYYINLWIVSNNVDSAHILDQCPFIELNHFTLLRYGYRECTHIANDDYIKINMNGIYQKHTGKYSKAFELFEKNAKFNSDSMYNLALCYKSGAGVLPDEKKYLEILQKCGDHPIALHILAHENDNRELFKRNWEENSYLPSLPYLASFYINENDEHQGIKLLQTGWGKYESQECLLELIFRLVIRKEPTDFLFSQLTNLSHIANCYENGIHVEKDDKKAFAYYKEDFCKNRSLNSLNNLIRCYEDGIGVEKSPEYVQTLDDLMVSRA
jgi:TPR repeat protein